MFVLRVPLRLFWSAVLAIAMLALPAAARHRTPPNPADGRYLATAYDLSGVTASGLYTHRHIVAADPGILPIGTIIRIRRAGRYSGEYVVADTGAKILGRHLDIYIPSLAACKKFGVRHVKVKVIRIGNNTDHSAKVSYHKVKQHVAAEVANKTAGGAATADDRSAKGANTAPAGTPVPAAQDTDGAK
ncbi:MAG: 3D domain-containing protein [Bryobacteraceae bacterium]